VIRPINKKTTRQRAGTAHWSGGGGQFHHAHDRPTKQANEERELTLAATD